MALTSLALARTVDVRVTDEAGLRLELPAQVGLWTGQEIRFCQNPQCQREVHAPPDRVPTACPHCNAPLHAMSLAESQLLPADTVVLKRIYRHPSGRAVHVSLVLSGRERASIHRPEVCLIGQGRTILDRYRLDVPIEGQPPLRVMVLDLRQEAGRTGADPEGLESYYAYWFVGKDRQTPYHWQRMWWMGQDRIFRNVAHRWAYIAIGGSRDRHSEAHREEIKAFLRDFYPQIALPAPPGT
jgi:hypothetical protein